MTADAGTSLDPKGRKVSAYRQSADKALAGPFRCHRRSYIRLKALNGRADGG